MSKEITTYSFYQELTVTSLMYPASPILFIDNKTGQAFKSTGILISNDATTTGDDIIISFGKDGMGNDVDDGKIKAGEQVVFDRRIETQIKIKKVAGNVPVRIWVW